MYDAWIQTSLPPLPMRLYSRRLIGAAIRGRPRTRVGGAVALRRRHEHAVVLAPDLVQRVAQGREEVAVRGDDGAVHVELDHRLRLADRLDLAGESAFCSFCCVTSVANLTTLKGLPLRSRIGL